MAQRMDPMTMQEVAAALGVSDSMIYLIEKRALEKLRKAARRLGYTPQELLGVVTSKHQINNTAIKHGERE